MTDTVMTEMERRAANLEEGLIALAKAQAAIGNVTKNAENAFFKDPKGKASKFANLAAVTAVVTPALTDNNLVLTNDILKPSQTTGSEWMLRTLIRHTNGTTVAFLDYPIFTTDKKAQPFGGGVTYARRYAMMALLNIATEDDDGNLASKEPPPKRKEVSPRQRLGKLLVDSGVKKDTLATVISERFDGKKTTVDEITDAEVTAWISDLEDGDANF